MSLILALTLGARPSYAQDAFHTDSGGRLLSTAGVPLVLEHTSVFVEVNAGLAKVTLTQFFHNPFVETVDARYLFPLPEDAAVHALELAVGERVLEGEIVTREEAQQRYAKAQQEGRKAAAVDQERPNLFTQRVSAICPEESVTVTLEYVDPVDLEDGLYSLHVPLTVGPRYGAEGAGDKARISTLYSSGEQPGLDLNVVIDEGIPLSELRSPSHTILAADHDWGSELELEASPTPDRDFVLEWSLAGSRPRAGLTAHRPDPDQPGWLSLTLEPQLLEDYMNRQPRELLFVLDTSGSMNGTPAATSQAAVQLALDRMEPHDRFNIVTFSSAASSLFDQPRSASEANIAAAKRWLAGQRAGGGTEMAAGIRHSLHMPGDPDALRLILMLTDGYIGNERQIFELTDSLIGASRVFPLGVGSSVNRYLLEGLAQAGRGDVAYMVNGDVQPTVEAWYERIAHPSLTDIELDWGELEVWDSQPEPMPDLFVGQPLRVMARYEGSGRHAVTVRARIGDEPITLRVPVDLPEIEEDNEALRLAFARAEIESLDWQKDSQGEITRIALEAGLVSAHTSLIAEDTEPSACAPARGEASVPSAAPAGVDLSAAGGRTTSSSQIDFEEVEIEAALVRPERAMLLDRNSSSFSPMIGTRDDFDEDLAQVDAVQGRRVFHDEEVIEGRVARPDVEILHSRMRLQDALELDETPGAMGVVRAHRKELQACYESSLRGPTYAGRIELLLEVHEGRVRSVEILEDEVGEGVAECLQKKIQRWRFPSDLDGDITLPFVFEGAD